jgi:hypothetical protein
MLLFSCLLTLYFAIQSWSTPVNITVHDPVALKSYSIELEESVNQTGSQLHNSLVSPLKIHPRSYKDQLSFHETHINISGQVITRTIPMINDVIIEGADGIINKYNSKTKFNYTYFPMPKIPFRLSPAECMEKSLSISNNSTIKNPYVEKTDGIYEAIWLMHFGTLRPVYKVRLPAISLVDLKDVYVDANTGEILRIEDAAQFQTASAQVFVYSPVSPTLNLNELKQVTLKDLVDVKEGGFLKGQYLSVKTCCQYFTCPDEGECTEDKRRCALKSHKNVRQTRELIELPTATLGLDPLVTLPETISVDTVRCTYLPSAKASYKTSDHSSLGFYYKPTEKLGLESDIDPFSEVQAYFSIMSFFSYIRSLTNQAFCLRSQAMSCNSDGSPVLDEHGLPKNPYRVFVNQLIPDMKLDPDQQTSPDSFLAQALEGKGTKNNPIKLDSFARMGNAAFVPALSTLKTPPRADEILSDLIRPFDHNSFFQGDRDFALDGDVVSHEFMHAVTTTLINKINSLGLGEWGIHSEPGSLNEAWSDYFAAAFTNKPALGEYASVRGGYGEVALRNIDNDARCPHDVIGEIHNDSLIWSGALWEIRSLVERSKKPSVVEFDRAVLATLAEATVTEDFKTQATKLLSNISARKELGSLVYSMAEHVLEKRGILDCFRAATLSSVDDKNIVKFHSKNLLFVPSKNQIGLKNYAPSTLQLEVGVPAGAKNMTVSWRQYLGGTGALLGTETTPDSTKNIEPLGILSNTDSPIKWKFENAFAIANGDSLISDAGLGKAVYKNGLWQYSMPLNFDHCDQRTIYLSILSYDFKYVLENIMVSFEPDISNNTSHCQLRGNQRGEQTIDKELLEGCSTTQTDQTMFLALIFFFLAVMRKRGIFDR